MPAEKGLKSGALGLISSVVIGVASTAPAYSLASTLGFVVAFVGLQTPIVAIIAFVPMLMISIGYSELNKADPDCGTTFTWAARAFGPRSGWMGGWGIVAADILVMASLAQIAGQYVFLLFNANGIGRNPTSGWVLLVGILWIVAMTYICYRGIEVSANFQKALLSIELVMLLVLSIVALVKVGSGHAPPGHLVVAGSWFNPFKIPKFSTFVGGFITMLFIYWGWDTAVAVNEETADASVTPGKAAIISTFLLLATYALVILVGPVLRRSRNDRDRARQHGQPGRRPVGARQLHLRHLGLRELPQPPPALDGAELGRRVDSDDDPPDGSHDAVDGRLSRRSRTPSARSTASTSRRRSRRSPWARSRSSCTSIMNYISAGTVIADSVTALGVLIAFYYGLTGHHLLLVLPQEPDEQPAQPLHARHRPARGRPHLVGRHDLQPEAGLGNRLELHALGHVVLAALGHRRRVHPRLRRPPARRRSHVGRSCRSGGRTSEARR